jgi:formate-dependent nitrite reductase membrane component NrfD
MIEYVNHRSNPGIDPTLHLWGWEIPVYLFVGGLVAGLMILSGYHILRQQWDDERTRGHYVTAPLLSLALLTIGMVALFLDLGNKFYVWRLYLTFEVTSPMSWGSWILLLVYPVLVASALLTLPESLPRLARTFPILGRTARALSARPGFAHATGFGNIVLGVLLGIYTGVLLSTLAARPLWNSALLGPLFLLSGLSTGAALLHLLSHLHPRPDRDDGAFTDAVISAMVHWLRPPDATGQGQRKLEHADNSFLTVELVLIALYLIGLLSSAAAHQQAVGLLFSGPWVWTFWIGVIGLGILLPLALQFMQAEKWIRSTIVPALLVLAGGFLLRVIIVYAGQESHWFMAAQ